MLKKYSIALAVMTILGASVPARAEIVPVEGFFLRPYVGASYQHTWLDYNNIPGTAINLESVLSDSLHGGDVHIGARVHRYFGVELSYMQTDSTKKTNVLGTGTSTTVDLRGLALDGMGYLPFENTNVEVIVTAGMARLRGHTRINADASTGRDSENNFRFGGGAQYWFDQNINARAIVRYQAANFGNSVDSAVLSSVGLNYQF